MIRHLAVTLLSKGAYRTPELSAPDPSILLSNRAVSLTGGKRAFVERSWGWHTHMLSFRAMRTVVCCKTTVGSRCPADLMTDAHIIRVRVGRDPTIVAQQILDLSVGCFLFGCLRLPVSPLSACKCSLWLSHLMHTSGSSS